MAPVAPNVGPNQTRSINASRFYLPRSLISLDRKFYSRGLDEPSPHLLKADDASSASRKCVPELLNLGISFARSPILRLLISRTGKRPRNLDVTNEYTDPCPGGRHSQ